ncbi:hypothetical protein EYF80_059521 [Liparis tanakae]|uniref:Uncharacterized protein n=1 Tax=Liparis tanakae TaxID=230148 RepID=A0A4Z2ENG9_9TELE|nr:hypothetical protein EYF80_059521 [Liparis tanakae]
MVFLTSCDGFTGHGGSGAAENHGEPAPITHRGLQDLSIHPSLPPLPSCSLLRTGHNFLMAALHSFPPQHALLAGARQSPLANDSAADERGEKKAARL